MPADPVAAPSEGDRPRERLWALGPAALSTVELLAVLLGTGAAREAAPRVAERLLAAGDGSLRRLRARPQAELLRLAGVGPAKGARLLAAFELAERMLREERPRLPRIRIPRDVVPLLAPRLRDLPVEEFHLVALDGQSQVLRIILITRGLLDGSLVHPREVFRPAIAEAAAGIIVVHNHPSGDPTPSPEDHAITRRLAEAGRLLGVPLFDHVIVGGDRYLSFAEQGMV
ncbi:MAG: DNA repair protein RadC [Gemmatimonadales bacterium]|nr:DNA repair protein RadC [Gemmatimonadales bacterium]